MCDFPEYINMNPGEECLEKNRAWQGCPTIAATKGGRLFAGWFTGGMFEPCIHNYDILVKSDDGGETWSQPILTVYSDYKNKDRNIDIQLWVDEDNRLWIMWTKSPFYEDSKEATIKTPHIRNYMKEFTGVEVLICENPDAEELSFERMGVVCGGFLRNKPIIRKNGDYVFPAYDWVNEGNYVLRISKDKGKTFKDVIAAPKSENGVFDETMAYECGDKLCIMARTKLGYYLHSYSDDDGNTWSEPSEYEKAPSTRFYIGRLSGGELCYVRNISDTKRDGMKIALSYDDGKTWPHQLILDERELLSYPDLCEGENGELYIIYDRERNNTIKLDRETWRSNAAKEILVCKITKEDIINGFVGENSFLSKVISKAGIDVVEK